MRIARRAPILRPSGAPRLNGQDLVMVTVSGQVAHPIGRAAPYRVGHDGVPRILPATGGIAVNQRIGDRCVGLAGDHIEPGAALHNNGREVVGGRNGPNLALLTYACVGNVARVVSGPCRGRLGTVSGKHGGIEHLLVDFPTPVLRRLQIGDQIQIHSYGLGARLLDHPDVEVMSCSPRLLSLWGLRSVPPQLYAPVTHLLPASIMGSGIGRPDSVRGDCDIQLFDPEIRRRFGLERLRFGDIVAVLHSDSLYGRAYRRHSLTVGIVVHGDSTISGHGPGLLTLLTSREGNIRPVLDPQANLAAILGLRRLAPPIAHHPLVGSPPARRAVLQKTIRALPDARRSAGHRRTAGHLLGIPTE
jgi:uncharacterized protein DUF4438